MNNILFEKGHWTRLLLDVMETYCLGARALFLFLFCGGGVFHEIAQLDFVEGREERVVTIVSPLVFLPRNL